MKMKAVYKYYEYFGRMGELSGVFVCDIDYANSLLDKGYEVRLGECLGKHSSVYTTLSSKTIKMISDDPAVVRVVEEHGLENGVCPFNCYEEEEDEDEEV